MERERGKEKEEKVNRAGLDNVPSLEKERGGVVDPRSHPPLPGLGTRRRRRVDGGDLLLLLLMLVVVAKKLLRVSSPFLLEETPPSPSNELPDLVAPPARKEAELSF